MSEDEWKMLRHRFYRLGHHGPALLIEMGVLSKKTIDLGFKPTRDEIREVLFEVVNRGRATELETLISRKETELLAEISHVGDPCQSCGLKMEEVAIGPCPVRKKERRQNAAVR